MCEPCLRLQTEWALLVFWWSNPKTLWRLTCHSILGGWWAFWLAGAWAWFVCDATHRWGNRPRDLIFPGGMVACLTRNLILKAPYPSFLLDLLPESPLADQSGLAPGDWSPRQLQVLFLPRLALLVSRNVPMLSGGSGMGAHPVVLAYSEQVDIQLELNSWFDANRVPWFVQTTNKSY